MKNIPIKYEERIVAFLDILGWSELVKLSIDDDEVRQKLDISLDYVKSRIVNAEQLQISTNLQITQFSDSIAISTNCSSIVSLYHFLETVCMVILDFVTLGFPVRGGITRGLLVHQGSKIFGPAQIRAYKLESEVAFYPRILVDDVVVDSKLNMAFADSDKYEAMIRKLWRYDKDGCITLDYLRPFITIDGYPIDPVWQRYYLEPAKKLIEKGLKEHKHLSKIYVKYKWLESYYKEVIQLYGLDKKQLERFQLQIT